ncbi:hypothetical protein BDQ17DRAFT_1333275 [Cyathus striatus]|nr:hypothetical protein BDQ17DRAFT_1333275 [Cyathus striatus]
MGGMQERITTTKKGSIASVQAIYMPADDLTTPTPATTFAHLDATTVLSCGIAELGIYPAVDPLDSKSRMLDPRIVVKDFKDHIPLIFHTRNPVTVTWLYNVRPYTTHGTVLDRVGKRVEQLMDTGRGSEYGLVEVRVSVVLFTGGCENVQ